ncbi:hypothetical protein CROQUDRAFT_95036 [Cronartium quercuum f. sp. fusiforme G11]|uniref:Reverse transcriptase Ty1/copia-type domain-containing protein n=1 Tax=Cronartium quercuum f. sp. fusiforme G11 TaxID=708437 RepID=A0A9P6T9R6_9BASI|nr:hypothetical protein CROQUDRAFT_95036 [Cronartium quercuum f. sp. fusiforme G11]
MSDTVNNTFPLSLPDSDDEIQIVLQNCSIPIITHQQPDQLQLSNTDLNTVGINPPDNSTELSVTLEQDVSKPAPEPIPEDINDENDNPSYMAAMKGPNQLQWKQAMKDEFDSFLEHNVGTLVNLPPEANILSAPSETWILVQFDIKMAFLNGDMVEKVYFRQV